MKKIYVLLLSTLCAILFAVGARAAALGDVDVNGAVDAADARLALRTAVGLEPAVLPGTEAFAAADADFSGAVTAEDARSILRAAVGLEDLADRLPESAALTEEELAARLRDGILEFGIEYGPGAGAYDVKGFVIDENGTTVISYHAIHLMTMIGVLNKPGCRVTEVLGTDPEHGFALIRVEGDVTPIPVNGSWYKEGDPVYSTDYMQGFHKAELLDAERAPTPRSQRENLLCVTYPEAEYGYDLESYPMLDHFGRAIGIFIESKFDDTSMQRVAFAQPLSYIKNIDVSAPRSVEQFSRDEWRVQLNVAATEIEMVRCGTAIIRVETVRPKSERVTVACAREDLLTCRVNEHADGPFSLEIFARECCENVPVTVTLEGMYETCTAELLVTVTEEGYVNMVGAPFMPDPGVIWGCLPYTLSVNTSFTGFYVEYQKHLMELSEEEIFYSYTDVLMQMGYTYLGVDRGANKNIYTFRLDEAGVTLKYQDWNGKVWIEVRIDSPDVADGAIPG